MNLNLQFAQGSIGVKLYNELEFNAFIKFLENNKMKDDSFVANTTWNKLLSLINLPINKTRFGGFKGYVILYLHYEHGLCYYLDEETALDELNAIYTFIGGNLWKS